MEQKAIIKNVNILDMRKTVKEALDRIEHIKNVNVILVSPKTAGYLTGIPVKNINTIAEVPEDVELQTCMSQVIINSSYLSGFSSPRFLFVMGNIIVEPDVTQELIESKLAGLAVMGKLVCPESVSGTLQSKAKLMMGGTITYPAGAVLVTHSLTLDNDYLNELNDDTHLVVTGSLRVVDHVSTVLIEQKIQKLHTHGSILCRQEHALAIKSRLVHTRSIIVIPPEYRLIEGNLPLDDLTLQTLENEKLFCMGDVIVNSDVSSQGLDAGISKLKALGVVLCPASLKDTLKTKCDMLDNRVILYEGTLWYIDDERHLLPDQFNYVDGPMTLLIRDELIISSDVSPETILERIHKIHNLGDIMCHPEQQAAVEARMGIRDGDVSTLSQSDAQAAEEGPHIGNANVLAL